MTAATSRPAARPESEAHMNVIRPKEREYRQSLIKVCLEANRSGVNQGTSGNVSVRWGDGMLITPSAMPYTSMTPSDVVYVDANGEPSGTRRPSSEWYFHHAILQARPDTQAIVHLHSPAATALATLRMGVPPFHYMVATAGGDTIRCADYATFGTPELAANAVDGLVGRKAVLLANHGQIALGETVDQALALAIEVESLCAQYLSARTIGEPVLLTSEQMAAVLEKFADYKSDPASTPDIAFG